MYNVELFNMFTNSFVDHFLIGEETAFGLDYIAPKAIEVKAPADINIELKNTCRVLDMDRDNMLVYNGYVQAFQRDMNETSITLAPLMMLLNETSMQNVADELNNQNWAYQIERQIYWDFMQSTPSLYRVPWVYASAYPIGNWGNNKKVGYGAELKSDMDCIIARAKTSGLYMRWGLYNSGTYLGRPSFGFWKKYSAFTIEADLDNVIDRKISETIKEGYNIAIVWYPIGSGNYQHTDAVLIDGEIVKDYPDASHKNDISDPRIIEKVIDHQPTADEANTLFASMLQAGSDNLDIELTFKLKDRLIDPYWSQGRPANIITSKKTYKTVCTGYSRKGELLTLRFGTVRQDLTQILNREGL